MKTSRPWYMRKIVLPVLCVLAVAIGRFSSDEFGYLHDDLANEDPAIFVLDHETEEFHKEAENIAEFLKKYNDFVPPKKKWYSFLFS